MYAGDFYELEDASLGWTFDICFWEGAVRLRYVQNGMLQSLRLIWMP